jgi:hypothetical protein
MQKTWVQIHPVPLIFSKNRIFVLGPHWGLCVTSTSGPHHGPRQGPRVDVGEVHLSGPLKFVSQMSIFCVLHAWTISKSTRGDLFPAGQRPLGIRRPWQYISREDKSGEVRKVTPGSRRPSTRVIRSSRFPHQRHTARARRLSNANFNGWH